MKRLCERLSVDKIINKVNCDTLESAILTVYLNDKYKFYLNSELIDVNDRFRIFQFNNKNYISKKTKVIDGKEECKLAGLAYEKLNDVLIDNYIIKIVQPKMIVIENDCYIITEYMGTSLQEIAYSCKLKKFITIDNLFAILDKFMSLGILYRGFLPRNTIVNENIIYLLDWEDAIFSHNNNGINLLWKTNFLLNWSYLFDVNILEEKIKKYENFDIVEPKLLKYEKNFKRWIGSSKNDYDLRNQILHTVMFAEKKINIFNEDFYIMPNDLAHLVSDLFNSDIDVLFDISCFVIRKKSEEIYYNFVKILSNVIVNLYYEGKEIRFETIKIILMLFELASIGGEKIEKYSNLKDINNELELINSYTSSSIDKFKKNFEICLNKLISEYNDKNKKIEIPNGFVKYLWDIKEEGN